MSQHRRAQCHGKWQRSCRGFRHPVEVKPMSPDYLRLALTTKPWFHIELMKKTVYESESSFLATWNCFFAHRNRQDYRSRNAQVEYQGQARYTRILECKPLINTSYRIRHRLDSLELKYFTSHNFCSLLIEQLINLEKVRTENLKYRTDLRD